MPTLATALTINMRGADIPTVTAKQHDANSRVLEVRLLDGENPLPLEAVSAALFVKKPDGTNVCSPGTVPDGEGNVLRFPLSAQTLAAAGIARCEIALYGGDGSLLSTIPFRMAVVASVRDEDAVVSSDEYSLLTETVLESRELVRRMEELLEAGPGDPSGPGLQIAAHNENADAHRDIRQSVADVAAGSYTKGEIDGLLEGLSPSEPGPAVDAYTKEETRRLVADHDSDSGAHDILRRELAEQIDAHTGDSAAHRDIRDTVAALEHSVYTRGDVDALAAGITAAFAETLGGYRTAEASDEALTRHSEDANTHRDIRDALAGMGGSRYTKEEADNRLSAHNGDPDAHSDLREAVGELAAGRYTQADADRTVSVHDGDPDAHGDLRRAVNEKASKPTTASATLTAAGWSGADAPYSQTVPVAGMAAGGVWHYDIAPQATAAQVSAFAAAMIWATGESAGACRFAAAGEKPETDLPIIIERLG